MPHDYEPIMPQPSTADDARFLEATAISILDKLSVETEHEAHIRNSYQLRRAAIEIEIAAKRADEMARLDALQREMDEALPRINARLAELRDHAQKIVLVLGKTVNGPGLAFMAVYSKGRITWNSDKLEALGVEHPAILTAKSIGAPSVAIRAIATKAQGENKQYQAVATVIA